MKSKSIMFLKIILICGIGLLGCLMVYDFLDTVWNGFILDWFDNNYMETTNSYSGTNENMVIVHSPNWPRVKILVLVLLAVNVVIWLMIVYFTAHFHAKNKVKKTITMTSGMLHDYMSQDREASWIFPIEYAEISAQMTEIKSTMQRHEQILKEEAARKNDLITYLAHDLKTPLTSVIGYLSLLEEAPDIPEKQRAKYVSITLDKAHRLEKLINEFFEITRYNLQQITLEKEMVDLYYMLVQMTDEFYPILSAHGNAASLQANETLFVHADPEKLARVFNNILKNAIAYSYPDTTIEIHAESDGKQVRISFCNQGKTIPKEKLKDIFEKFFRLDDARTTNTGGAGLGLAIAKEIVTLHGGTITAESENGMTVFSVVLPV